MIMLRIRNRTLNAYWSSEPQSCELYAGARVAVKMKRNQLALTDTIWSLSDWGKKCDSRSYSLILCLRPTTESSLNQWVRSVFAATTNTLLIKQEWKQSSQEGIDLQDKIKDASTHQKIHNMLWLEERIINELCSMELSRKQHGRNNRSYSAVQS